VGTSSAWPPRRLQLAEHLAKQFDRLGLERRAKPLEDLQNYLARKAAETDAQTIDSGGE
jgi:hypothetical protein